MRYNSKFHREIMLTIIFILIICIAMFSVAFAEYLGNRYIYTTFNEFIVPASFLIIFAIGSIIYFLLALYVLNLFENKTIFEPESQDYYRDLIKKYSPAQLSYVDNYSIELKKDILATILSLHLKGNIKISKDKIEFISKFKTKNEKYYELSATETLVIDCLEKKISPFRKKYSFENYLLNDLRNVNLTEKRETISPHLKAILLIYFIYGVLLVILQNFVPNVLASLFKAFGWLTIVFSFSLIFINKDLEKNGPFAETTYKKLTDEGLKLRRKLIGLKRFLADYSEMNKKSIAEIELWDEYMIYSVILNNNKKIQKELFLLLKKYLSN